MESGNTRCQLFFPNTWFYQSPKASEALFSKQIYDWIGQTKNVFSNVLQTEVPLRQIEFLLSKRKADGKFQIDFVLSGESDGSCMVLYPSNWLIQIQNHRNSWAGQSIFLYYPFNPELQRCRGTDPRTGVTANTCPTKKWKSCSMEVEYKLIRTKDFIYEIILGSSLLSAWTCYVTATI